MGQYERNRLAAGYSTTFTAPKSGYGGERNR
jgi:hypothetical protein